MKKIVLLSLLLSVSFLGLGADVKSFITSADVFFKRYVDNGSVAYVKLKKNFSEIEGLYKEVETMNLTGIDNNSKKAFYINAYNIIVIYWVTKHYPLKSPLDDSGFFDKVKHQVAGEEMTLNALEIKKMLMPYKDGRFHFALACAAKSCPPLASFAFTSDKIEQQLTERTTLALNNKEWIKVHSDKKSVELSKIFKWYSGDFTTDNKSPLEWINQFRKIKIPVTYSVGFYEYDWTLNDM